MVINFVFVYFRAFFFERIGGLGVVNSDTLPLMKHVLHLHSAPIHILLLLHQEVDVLTLGHVAEKALHGLLLILL